MSNTVLKLAKKSNQQANKNYTSTFSAPSEESVFELIQRKAKAYSQSGIVPDQFCSKYTKKQKTSSGYIDIETENPQAFSNCIIALEMAQRMDMNPLMLMQNSYIVSGKLGWSSTFIIARINSCGRFTPLRFKFSGEGMTRSCIAYATDKETGQELESVKVTMQMAKAEGWLDKKGSKWKTMPDLMLQYRAASFFGRTYAADMLLGMQSEEELRDIEPYEIKKVYENSKEVVKSNNSIDALVQQAEAEAHQSSTEDENIKD